MTDFSKNLRFAASKALSIRPSASNGEGGIRTRGPAFDRTRL